MLAGDSTYRPTAPSTRRILSALTHAGHEIGLHGSFATVKDREADDRAAPGASGDWLTRPIDGVRQHFLRMRAGDSPSGSCSKRVSSTTPPGGSPTGTDSV